MIINAFLLLSIQQPLGWVVTSIRLRDFRYNNIYIFPSEKQQGGEEQKERMKSGENGIPGIQQKDIY